MQRIPLHFNTAFIAVLCLAGASALAEDTPPVTSIVISVAEQKLVVLHDGGWIKKYPISTSKFGLGDSFGSYKTPVGKLRVCEKIGNDLTSGAVIKQRHATGEVLPVNAPGRDPIVTRIIWLDGLESQNANARQRGIYIHGTVEESKIGQPVSYGCIRMRSKDVVEVFDEVPLDTEVSIVASKLPKIAKYTPPKPASAPAPAPVVVVAPPPKSTPSPKATPVFRLIGESTPAPTVAARTTPAPEKDGKHEPSRHSTASVALKGSMLDAGLPQGPKIPTLPAPAEPKDVPRFSPISPGMTPDNAFSLHGISRDLSPEVRAAEAEARDAAAKSERGATPAETPKPSSKVALRSGSKSVK